MAIWKILEADKAVPIKSLCKYIWTQTNPPAAPLSVHTHMLTILNILIGQIKVLKYFDFVSKVETFPNQNVVLQLSLHFTDLIRLFWQQRIEQTLDAGFQ